MANVLPAKPLEKIAFCENHIAPFTANAVAIGTTAAAVTDLQTKTTAARDAYNAQQAAMQLAKAATSTYHEAVRTMAGAASDIIKQVKAKAAGTIYQVARQLGTSGGFQIIGATGSRKFDDPTVPAGTAVVTYRVVPLRSTVAGPANEFTVKFGAPDAAGGAMTATVVQPSPKLAA